MNLRKLIGISALAFSSLFYSNCNEDIFNTNQEKNMHCPCEATLRTKHDYGLGSFHINMPDNHDIVGECGFTYHENRRGGTGSTLEEIGCEDGVLLIWSYSSLGNIYVKKGWMGQTDTGLKIGSTIEEYLEKYPDAIPYWTSGNRSYITPHFMCYFDDDLKISEMSLSDYDFKEELDKDEVEHSCPCEATLYTQKEVNEDSYYNFKKIGLGDFKINSPNSFFPIENCGFQYYCKPSETFGRYDVIGCSDGVYMSWGDNNLEIISVRKGWEGETDRGLRIGDSRERFLELYPKSRRIEVSEYLYGKMEIYSWRYLKISIDSIGNVDMMGLGRVNRDTLNYDWGYPIVPWQDEPMFCEKE